MTIGTASTQRFDSFTIFQNGQNNGAKIWAFDATSCISRYIKLSPDMNFTDEIIVQCFVPVVKILFL